MVHQLMFTTALEPPEHRSTQVAPVTMFPAAGTDWHPAAEAEGCKVQGLRELAAGVPRKHLQHRSLWLRDAWQDGRDCCRLRKLQRDRR